MAKLVLDLHDIYNKGKQIDTELNRIIDDAVNKKIKLVEIIPGKGSGQLKKKVLRFLNQKHIRNKYHRIDKDSKNGKKGDKYILSVTENGFGKRTASNEFRVTNRGGKGIIGIVNSSRNGNVSSSFPVFEGDEILISTNKGRVIRVAVKEIRIAGRNTQGVRIIRLSGDEKVVSAIKIDVFKRYQGYKFKRKR